MVPSPSPALTHLHSGNSPSLHRDALPSSGVGSSMSMSMSMSMSSASSASSSSSTSSSSSDKTVTSTEPSEDRHVSYLSSTGQSGMPGTSLSSTMPGSSSGSATTTTRPTGLKMPFMGRPPGSAVTGEPRGMRPGSCATRRNMPSLSLSFNGIQNNVLLPRPLGESLIDNADMTIPPQITFCRTRFSSDESVFSSATTVTAATSPALAHAASTDPSGTHLAASPPGSVSPSVASTLHPLTAPAGPPATTPASPPQAPAAAAPAPSLPSLAALGQDDILPIPASAFPPFMAPLLTGTSAQREAALRAKFDTLASRERRRLQGSALAKCPDDPFSMSVGLEQFCKNRYPNVWPYNTNRVKLPTEDRDPRTPVLKTPPPPPPPPPPSTAMPPAMSGAGVLAAAGLPKPGDARRIEDTDARTYINASHIAVKTRHGVRRYIATQAPMKDTALDFWRMVWNERVLLVLMVTQEQERGRSQCYRYWPADPVPASQTTADGGHGDHSGQGGHSGPAAGAVAGEGAAASESSSSSTSSSRSVMLLGDGWQIQNWGILQLKLIPGVLRALRISRPRGPAARRGSLSQGAPEAAATPSDDATHEHRIVYHFQHMTWLDCSIPSRVDTLDWFVCLSHIVRTEHRRYMSVVRRRQAAAAAAADGERHAMDTDTDTNAATRPEDEDELDGPMLVHCTAGCGRTGTVIAADILLTRDLASDAPNVVYPDTQASQQHQPPAQPPPPPQRGHSASTSLKDPMAFRKRALPSDEAMTSMLPHGDLEPSGPPFARSPPTAVSALADHATSSGSGLPSPAPGALSLSPPSLASSLPPPASEPAAAAPGLLGRSAFTSLTLHPLPPSAPAADPQTSSYFHASPSDLGRLPSHFSRRPEETSWFNTAESVCPPTTFFLNNQPADPRFNIVKAKSPAVLQRSFSYSPRSRAEPLAAPAGSVAPSAAASASPASSSTTETTPAAHHRHRRCRLRTCGGHETASASSSSSLTPLPASASTAAPPVSQPLPALSLTLPPALPRAGSASTPRFPTPFNAGLSLPIGMNLALPMGAATGELSHLPPPTPAFELSSEAAFPFGPSASMPSSATVPEMMALDLPARRAATAPTPSSSSSMATMASAAAPTDPLPPLHTDPTASVSASDPSFAASAHHPSNASFTGGLTTDPVMEVVDQLRSQRMCLVQNTAQFAVLYELLFRRYAMLLSNPEAASGLAGEAMAIDGPSPQKNSAAAASTDSETGRGTDGPAGAHTAAPDADTVMTADDSALPASRSAPRGMGSGSLGSPPDERLNPTRGNAAASASPSHDAAGSSTSPDPPQLFRFLLHTPSTPPSSPGLLVVESPTSPPTPSPLLPPPATTAATTVPSTPAVLVDPPSWLAPGWDQKANSPGETAVSQDAQQRFSLEYGRRNLSRLSARVSQFMCDVAHKQAALYASGRRRAARRGSAASDGGAAATATATTLVPASSSLSTMGQRA